MHFSTIISRAHNYTKEEGMQLIETAKFERLLKIALSHAHALKIIIEPVKVKTHFRVNIQKMKLSLSFLSSHTELTWYLTLLTYVE